MRRRERNGIVVDMCLYVSKKDTSSSVSETLLNQRYTDIDLPHSLLALLCGLCSTIFCVCAILFTRYRSHTQTNTSEGRDPVYRPEEKQIRAWVGEGESSLAFAPLTPLIDRLYSCVCLCVSGVREVREYIQCGYREPKKRDRVKRKQKKSALPKNPGSF